MPCRAVLAHAWEQVQRIMASVMSATWNSSSKSAGSGAPHARASHVQRVDRALPGCCQLSVHLA